MNSSLDGGLGKILEPWARKAVNCADLKKML